MLKSEYDENVIREEHEETYQTGANAKIDYRYVGANPNNYVCLEANGECTDNQLYRIVGVMPTQKDESGLYENRIKLVKYTYYTNENNENNDKGKWQWSGKIDVANNDWTQSTLNKETLNGTYWNEIGDYQKYIDIAKWYLGSYNKTEDSGLVKDIYITERRNKSGISSPNVISTKNYIGLIYASDFGYATNGNDTITRQDCLNRSPFYIVDGNSGWESASEYHACVENDWLYQNYTYYSLTPRDTDGGTMVCTVVSYGLGNDGTGMSYGQRIYPSFYLKSEVKYLSGTGTKSDPYQVTID